ncbi:UV DNA damage repair endonuclease UvsE [Occallatibacter savannae]|uniref:UV DNA damage repair endonuclease UvsE n=1 Tax=Occallatibacter savannae TaxID=1002691 RepID=UPI00194EC4CB|nr:UV DNA damage repair endonuclease UvsE [Occallatibacter savannae]
MTPAKKPADPAKLKAQKKRDARARLKEEAAAAAEARANNPLFRCPDLDSLPAATFPREAMRLGFAVKVMGQPGLKSNDTRRWQQNPHLKVSLGYLCEIFEYLRKHDIHMYRMSSDIAPYQTHPDMPQFHNMINESRDELALIGRLARQQDLRLSFHPSQYIVLNSDNEQLTQKSIADLESQSEMLDLMECGPEAVLVIHVGGAYGDRASGCDRWCATWSRLSERVKRRLVLENDDIRFSAADVLSIHERTGVRCVFDYQHHWCFNPEGLPLLPTLERFLRTWPSGVRPKIHYSCARTEMREIKRKNRKTGLLETVLQPPVWTGHADYNNPFETIPFLRSIAHLDTDIMLESKAKDLSLLRLRADIARYAPDLAPRYAISAAAAADDAEEIPVTDDPDPTAEAA